MDPSREPGLTEGIKDLTGKSSLIVINSLRSQGWKRVLL
jgi:hypothetical protein